MFSSDLILHAFIITAPTSVCSHFCSQLECVTTCCCAVRTVECVFCTSVVTVLRDFLEFCVKRSDAAEASPVKSSDRDVTVSVSRLCLSFIPSLSRSRLSSASERRTNAEDTRLDTMNTNHRDSARAQT